MAPKSAPKAAAKADAAPKAAAKEKKEKKTIEEEKPKVPAPDRAAYDEKLAAINAEIETLQKSASALTAKINERSGGKDEFFAKKAELRAQLDEFSSKMDELQGKKDEINKQVGEKRQEAGQMKQDLVKMKKTIGYNSEQDIDERIAKIHAKMTHDSISLKEEKQYMQEIQALKRNRPKVSQVKQMEDNLGTFDRGLSMKENIQIINEEMAKWRDAKKKVQEMIAELVQNRQSQVGDTPKFYDERTEINTKIQGKIKERNELRDEFKQAEAEFREAQNEFRRARAEKAREEREKRQAEYEQRQRLKEAEKLDTQPYVSEITLLEQTILFCKSLVQSKGGEDKEEKKETNYDTIDGAQILLKK